MANNKKPLASDNIIKYKLEKIGTEMGVGWFSCIPEKQPDFEKGLQYSLKNPNDQFMHKYLLEMAAKLEPDKLESRIETGKKEDNLHLLALLYEACILNEKFDYLKKEFVVLDIEELGKYTPLIYIHWSVQKNTRENFYWLNQFSRNANLLSPLPSPEETEFSIPFDLEAIDQWRQTIVSIREVASSQKRVETISSPKSLKEMAKKVSKRLESLGILTGWETRPEATLSPYAIERPWNLDITVRDRRNHWHLTGTQISYGRGLNIHQGRISCIMEVVERYSGFASFDSGKALGYKKRHSIVKGRYEDMLKKGFDVLDPNKMCLEVPYLNQEICWVAGEMVAEGGSLPVYIPSQLVFLFSNLDEISLTSGLPSNGLAAGNSIEEAKLSGLLEVIERDAGKIVPYARKRSFLLEAGDGKINDILNFCKKKGIQIQFLDITTEFGIPCYKAFVQGPGGVILKGSAAHLDGRRAALAAMTEIPYPYPYWFGSMAATQGIETLDYEDLPNYSSGDVSKDLHLLEKLLTMNGYRPIYVDLTREDLDIPVVKTLVPGLELMTVLDRFTPLGIRQFGYYTKGFN